MRQYTHRVTVLETGRSSWASQSLEVIEGPCLEKQGWSRIKERHSINLQPHTHAHIYKSTHKLKGKSKEIVYINVFKLTLTFKKKNNFLTHRFSFTFLIFSPFHALVITWCFLHPVCLPKNAKQVTGRPQEGTNPVAPDPENRRAEGR